MSDSRHDWEPISPEEAVERLTDAGLLTERQAEAYVLRRIEATPRYATAEAMDLSEFTVDDYVEAAEEKIEQAEATLEALEEIRHRPMPDECEECGATIVGRWATDEDGTVLCPDCAGLDDEAF